MSKGLFITIEGADGVGKTSIAELLTKQLNVEGKESIQTNEPGGCDSANMIRQIILEAPGDFWEAESEILLFLTSRLENLNKTVRPALKAGKNVICDRYLLSTIVYQGYVEKALSIKKIVELHKIFKIDKPDLNFIIKLDPEEALKRTGRRDDTNRFDENDFKWYKKITESFIHEAKNPSYTNNNIIIETDGLSLDDVVAKIKVYIDRQITENKKASND